MANVNAPSWQPPPTGLTSTINTNLENIREWAILDSGASSHFLQVDAPLLQKRKTANPIIVTVANGEKASSTHEGFLDVPGLPTAARNAHVIPGIKHSLLSIVRLSNAGCEVKFHKWGIGVEVRYRGKVIMEDRKSTINGLWYVPITQNSEVNPNRHTESRNGVTTDPMEELNPEAKLVLYGTAPGSAGGFKPYAALRSKPYVTVCQTAPYYTGSLKQKLSIKRDGRIAIRNGRVANCATHPTPRFQTTTTTELNTPRH